VASHETVKPAAKPTSNKINQFSEDKKKGVNILSKKTPSAFSQLKQTVKVEEPRVTPVFTPALTADNPWSNSPFRKVEKKNELKSEVVASVACVKAKLDDLDLNDSMFETIEEKSPQSRTPKAETFNHVEPISNHIDTNCNHTEPIISNHIEQFNNYIQPTHNWFDDDSFSDGPPSHHGSVSSDYKKSSVTSLKRSSHKEVEIDLVLVNSECDDAVFVQSSAPDISLSENEVQNDLHQNESTCNNEVIHNDIALNDGSEVLCNHTVSCSNETKVEKMKPVSNQTSFDSEFDSARDEFFSSCSDARDD